MCDIWEQWRSLRTPSCTQSRLLPGLQGLAPTFCFSSSLQRCINVSFPPDDWAIIERGGKEGAGGFFCRIETRSSLCPPVWELGDSSQMTHSSCCFASRGFWAVRTPTSFSLCYWRVGTLVREIWQLLPSAPPGGINGWPWTRVGHRR